jgi:uncharacterized membrane protein YeaQ/YmgE (transglycosylase-associated protein family)
MGAYTSKTAWAEQNCTRLSLKLSTLSHGALPKPGPLINFAQSPPPLAARMRAVAANAWLPHRGDANMNISGESLLVILVVGIAAGWLAGQVVQGTGFGLVGDLIVGVAGSFIASWLLPQLGIHLGSGIVSAIINAAIGAILLLLLIGLLRGRSGWGGSWGGGWRRRWW